MSNEIKISKEQVDQFNDSLVGKKIVTEQVLGSYNDSNYRQLYNMLNYRGLIKKKRLKRKFKII